MEDHRIAESVWGLSEATISDTYTRGNTKPSQSYDYEHAELVLISKSRYVFVITYISNNLMKLITRWAFPSV